MRVKLVKQRIISLWLINLIVLGMLGGCKKDEEEVELPYYQEYILEDENSIDGTILDFIKLVQEGNYTNAYGMIHTTNDLYTQEAFEKTSLVTDIQKVEGMTLYRVTDTGCSIELLYGTKSGEAMSNPTKKEQKQGIKAEYLGDYIVGETIITIPYEMVNNQYYIGVKESDISTQVIALKTLEGVRVYVDGVLLDSRERDDYGYYLITGFIDTDELTVTLETDVETKDIYLPTKLSTGAIVTDASGMIVTDTSGNAVTEAPVNTDENAVSHPNGYIAYDYTNWQTFRQTEEDACEWLKKGLQVLYSSYELQETDIYNSQFSLLLSQNCNIESLKTSYVKYIGNYASTKSRYYSDCTIIDVNLVDETTMTKKGLSNKMIDGTTMQVYVDVSYSYYVNKLDSQTNEVIEKTIRSGYLERLCMYLTQDNGKWRFMGVDNNFFKNIF